jgi:hypothetical protein
MARHHTKDKGDLAVVKVHADLVDRGALVLLPLTEHAPFDVVAYLDGQFFRVQVKYRSTTNGVVHVRFRTTWADRHGVHTRPMPLEEVDVIAIYCPDNGEIYYLDPSGFRQCVSLRVAPTRNSQRKNVLQAQDFTAMPPASRSGLRAGQRALDLSA